jgi:hypothetical protein
MLGCRHRSVASHLIPVPVRGHPEQNQTGRSGLTEAVAQQQQQLGLVAEHCFVLRTTKPG